MTILSNCICFVSFHSSPIYFFLFSIYSILFVLVSIAYRSISLVLDPLYFFCFGICFLRGNVFCFKLLTVHLKIPLPVNF